MIGFRERDLTF